MGETESERAGTRGEIFWLALAAAMSAGSYLVARAVKLGPVPGPFAYWPIIGLHCGLLMRRPRREWWRIGLAVACAQIVTIWIVRGNLAGGATVFGAIGGACEGTAAAFILCTLGKGHSPLGGFSSFAVFVLGAVMLVPLAITPLSALAFSGGLHLSFFDAWWPLFLGNVFSLLLFTPLAAREHWPQAGEPFPWSASRAELVLCQASILAFSVLAFAGPAQAFYVVLPYLLLPLLAWAALRCGPGSTAVSVVIFATVSAYFTARGRGPFGAEVIGLRLLEWQGCVAFSALIAMLLSALTEQRRVSVEKLALEVAVREAVFESSSALIVLKDLERRYVLVNGAVEKLFGRPRAELIGRRLEDLAEHPAVAQIREHEQRVLEKREPLTFEESLEIRGQQRTFLLTRFPVADKQGTIRYLGMIGRDETLDRELAERLQRTGRAEMLGQLAAGLTHDLNNVLAVVVTNAQLLREDPSFTEAERASMLGEIHEAADRAVSFTRKLLAFGRAPVETRRPLVDEVLGALAPLLKAFARGNIDFSSDLRAGEARVSADRAEIEQIVLNLVSNARDAIPRVGRIALSTCVVSRDEVNGAPHAALARKWLRLCVSDTGAGMDAETLARLFEAFFTTKGARGTGLGLYTISLLVRKAGGTIGADSKPGAGTTFTVHLPLLD